MGAADSAWSEGADKLDRARMAKSAIQRGLREQADVATAGEEVAGKKARRFIELPGVPAGSYAEAALCGLPWPPLTLFLTQILLTIKPIQRCPILAKPRWCTAKACSGRRN